MGVILAFGGTAYPTTLDAFPHVVDFTHDVIADHINSITDAIEALQARVGVTDSAVVGSHEYRLRSGRHNSRQPGGNASSVAYVFDTDNAHSGTDQLAAFRSATVDRFVVGGGGATDLYLHLAPGQAAAVSPTGTGRIRYNNTTKHFEVSENGGVWTQLSTAATLTMQQAYGAGENITTTAADNGAFVLTNGSTNLAHGALRVEDTSANAGRTAVLVGIEDANVGSGTAFRSQRLVANGVAVRAEVFAAASVAWSSGLVTPTTTAVIFGDGDTVLGSSAMAGAERLRVVGDVRVEGNLVVTGTFPASTMQQTYTAGATITTGATGPLAFTRGTGTPDGPVLSAADANTVNSRFNSLVRITDANDGTGPSFYVTRSTEFGPIATFESTVNDNGGSGGEVQIIHRRNNGSLDIDGVDSDVTGRLTFWGNNDGTPTLVNTAEIRAILLDTGNLSEDGALAFRTIVAGTTQESFRIAGLSASVTALRMNSTTLLTLNSGGPRVTVAENLEVLRANNAQDGPVLDLRHTRTNAGQATDRAGTINFYSADSTFADTLFASLAAGVTVATNGAEDGSLTFSVAYNGGMVQALNILSDSWAFQALTTTASLGFYTSSTTDVFTVFQQSPDTAVPGPLFSLYRHRDIPAVANDYLGCLQFDGDDDATPTLNHVTYGEFRARIVSPVATSKAADFYWRLMGNTSNTMDDAMRLTSGGVLSVDLAGGGSPAQVDLFDDYDDAMVLREMYPVTRTRRDETIAQLEEMGVVERKESGKGHLLHIQPMFALLAGADVQNRNAIDALRDENRALRDKLEELESRIAA